MSDELKESFKGKTGTSHQFNVSNEYPYLILESENYGFKDDDSFILSSNDGAYTEEVKFSNVKKENGFIITDSKGVKYTFKSQTF